MIESIQGLHRGGWRDVMGGAVLLAVGIGACVFLVAWWLVGKL